MTGWDAFNKYVGVQGIMALGLIGGYIAMTIRGTTVPDPYSQVMTLVIGYYFAKNGTGAIAQLLGAFRGATSKTYRKG